MRLMPLGQHDAHRLLAGQLARVSAAVDRIEEDMRKGHRPSAFMPAFDIATMAQQYVRSRLFRS
jgi:urease accessory protein UreF